MTDDSPGMELDISSTRERKPFSFQKVFNVNVERSGTVECDASVTGHVHRMGSRIIMHADVSCNVRMECGRCLTRFDLPLETDFDMVFHMGQGMRADVDVGEEDDFVFIDSTSEKQYDIFPRVREAVILELPIQPRCRENCRGLCSGCGANLNEEKCKCEGDGGDPRWAPLMNLIDKKKND